MCIILLRKNEIVMNLKWDTFIYTIAKFLSIESVDVTQGRIKKTLFHSRRLLIYD